MTSFAPFPPWAHVVSISGGKDSTALYLLALERMQAKGREFIPVFADTGNEHEWTYEAVANIARLTGGPEPVVVKADLGDKVLGRRKWIKEKWPTELTAGKPGKWVRERYFAEDEVPPEPLSPPDSPFLPKRVVGWKWNPAIRPLSADEAAEIVAGALEVMHPTGNPFLDLCLWKGLFPSSQRRFCTEFLKVYPINDQVIGPLIRGGRRVVSWQGVRAEESRARALLKKWQRIHQDGNDVLVYRPLLRWKLADVWEMHDKHGIPRNRLYSEGMTRVGCMPCIMAKKMEIREIAAHFPEHIDRIERWEALVRKASRSGLASFMAAVDDPKVGYGVTLDELRAIGGYTIRDKVEWSRTSRGGLQSDMLLDPAIEFGTACNQWGACE